MRWLTVVAALAAASAASSSGEDAPPDTDHVQVLAINDFHGALEPPGTEVGEVPAGGAAYLAAHLRRLRAGQERTVTVGAGDLIGGSPLASAHFHDEPAVAALDAMGLRVSAMGNHELDEGVAELERLQRGGCHVTDRCAAGATHPGARFGWLAANTLRDGEPLLPPTALEDVGGYRIGFVGLTLRETPYGVAPGGADGLTFVDEAETANTYARALKRDGADAVFVLLHEGGRQRSEDPNACEDLGGPVVGIAGALSDDVDAVATGHTHDAYVCRAAGKVIASAASDGRLVTDWDLAFDPATRELVSVAARNEVVDHDIAPDPEVQAIADAARERVAPLAERVVGHLAEPLDEAALGTVIADAHLTATRAAGADVGLMNRAGVRGGLPAGPVTYGDAFDVLPFSHDVVVRTYTGTQLHAALEQQHDRPNGTRDLGKSSNLAFEDGEVVVDGRRLGAGARVQVAMNRFLAEGGDGYSALRAGTPPLTGPTDVDALAAFLGADL